MILWFTNCIVCVMLGNNIQTEYSERELEKRELEKRMSLI